MAPEQAGGPSRAELVEAVAASQRVAKAQEYATSLRNKAATITIPSERERLVKEAYAKEVEAHGEQSKMATRLQSGTWQGGAAGGGIGLGTGLGLGTVVGTLVGGILSIPTTGLGILIGAGAGAIHGPWIKVGGKDKKWTDATPEEVVDHYESVDGARQPDTTISSTEEQSVAQVKKKPRKLEIRSQSHAGGPVQPLHDGNTTTTRSKPKKSKDQSTSRTKPLPKIEGTPDKENVDTFA